MAASRPAFVEHLHEVKISAEREIEDPVDRERLESALADALRLAAGAGRARPESRND